MERQHGISMLGWRRGMTRWEDDPVQRRDVWCWRTGQEADFSLEGNITTGGLDRGDRNNSFVKINDRD